ncbi:hypothetical protein [Nocardioides ferulae]|uniref:hypothetical protein n=1 Tax=Nocardioides ferulae TaxID=2340821 RepID=UPI000EB1BF0C|nr:hypothetical protein [Nocardioides ferulae]
MLIIGLVLVVAGALLIVGAVGTASGSVEFLGTDIAALTTFFLGVAAGLAVMLGLALAKFGAKRTLAQRRERARLGELSRKLDEVERDNSDRQTDS